MTRLDPTRFATFATKALGCCVPLAVVLAVGLPARPSVACNCKPEGPVVFPDPESLAPLNTRIYIFLPHDANARPDAAPPITLRSTDSPQPIAVTTRWIPLGPDGLAVISPTQLLAAATRYEVAFPSGTAQFTTGDRTDVVPPTWPGIRDSAFRRGDEDASCPSGEPNVGIVVEGPVDDTWEAGTHPDRRHLFQIWVSATGDSIDYQKPPDLYDWSSEPGNLAVGRSSSCGHGWYRFPPDVRAIRVGLRPMDLAGNIGTSSEISLEARQGATARPTHVPRFVKPLLWAVAGGAVVALGVWLGLARRRRRPRPDAGASGS